MNENELVRVPVTTRASITHLGSLDSFDITSGGKSLAPQKVFFDITYNKREDCELQEGNEGSEVSST